MKLFNVIELPEYRVKKNIDHTQLKAGDELPAFLYQIFGKEWIVIGCSMMAVEYFNFILAVGELERILPH
jgi:hypothetical protein